MILNSLMVHQIFACLNNLNCVFIISCHMALLSFYSSSSSLLFPSPCWHVFHTLFPDWVSFCLCRRIGACCSRSMRVICFLAAVSIMPGQELDEPGAEDAGVKELILSGINEWVAAGGLRNFSSGMIAAKECLQIICDGCLNYWSFLSSCWWTCKIRQMS